MTSEATIVTRAELLQRLDAGRAPVMALLAELTEAQMTTPGIVGVWSVQDTIAHFIAHEQRALDELRHALRGERLHIDHAATDAFNAGAIAAYRGQPTAHVLAAWDCSFQQVVAAVSALPDAAFTPGNPVEAALDDTIDGALANNTYAHYAEHLPQLATALSRPT